MSSPEKDRTTDKFPGPERLNGTRKPRKDEGETQPEATPGTGEAPEENPQRENLEPMLF